ncbi:hypothetical protein XcodCFBP4690_21830 [Xanthomonas codiaei]|uniref:Uncharacterized protein n=1 Tax=Xanthomonas codiaei TaxID=56463 RepID=A0A2S7C3F9_9XANT|nr:hypothetical protein XcodCFBP4690_21830 [Xanthomonas codiaei]
MGNISFLTGASSNSPSSIGESIYQLENCSVLFLAAWQKVCPDLVRAARVSSEAMAHLDHIVNVVLRARDDSKAANTYAGSQLEAGLNGQCGLSVVSVTRAQQQALPAAGPGNGVVPGTGAALTLERLLNKIKHRRPNDSNFRVDQSGQHIFVVAVDKPNHQPDSIVEFPVKEFCVQCARIAQYT